MSYFQCILTPVPAARRADYIALSSRCSEVFIEYGALRYVEAEGDDLPAGKINDMRTAVVAQEDELIFFAVIEWPDKAASDTGWAKVMQDSRMQFGPDLPFAAGRMIFGGFAGEVDLRG